MLEKSQKPHKKQFHLTELPPLPPTDPFPTTIFFVLLPFSRHLSLLPPILTLVAGKDGGGCWGGAENSFIRTKITTTWREPGATHTHTCTYALTCAGGYKLTRSHMSQRHTKAGQTHEHTQMRMCKHKY